MNTKMFSLSSVYTCVRRMLAFYLHFIPNSRDRSKVACHFHEIEDFLFVGDTSRRITIDIMRNTHITLNIKITKFTFVKK